MNLLAETQIQSDNLIEEENVEIYLKLFDQKKKNSTEFSYIQENQLMKKGRRRGSSLVNFEQFDMEAFKTQKILFASFFLPIEISKLNASQVTT